MADLSSIVLTLTNLKSVRISSYWQESLPFSCTLPSLAAAWSHLTSIEILGIVFTTFGDLVAFFCALPALKTLLLLGVSWKTLTQPPDNVYLPKHLHTLRLMSGSGDLIEWMLLSPSSLPPISTLSFEGVKPPEAHLIYDFISAVSGTLHRLSIYFDLAATTMATENLICGHPKLRHVPELFLMRYAGKSVVRT
jgi:hypothetical protein